MLTLKGTYENGKVELSRNIKFSTKQKVLITFIEEEIEEEEEILRAFTLNNETKAMKDYLSDEREDLYQEYLKK